MTDNARFWDKTAARYAKAPVRDEAAYAQTLERTRAHLKPTDSVLEIGCGTGTTALKLASSVGSLVATDISTEMIAIANEKVGEGEPQNILFRQSGTGDEAFEGGPFDVVLAFNLLHLLEDTEGTIQRARSALSPGGLFISKTVCLADAALIFRPLIGLMRCFGKAPFVRYLRMTQLEQMIEEAGFEIVETGTYPAKPPSRFIVARKI